MICTMIYPSPIEHKPEQQTNTQQQITPIINLSQMNSQPTNTQQTTEKQTSYTIQNLQSAIQIGNLTQAEKILNNLINNGQISQSKANMASTVIKGLTKLKMQNQPISNVLSNLTNSFQQLYQKYIRTGKMPDNLIELANVINATTSLLPQYSALVPPNVKAEISRLTALQSGGMGTIPGVLYQAIEEQRPVSNIIVQ
ncbi:viral structural protein [Acidianus two-tailed virus 2]|nr:viral structural protein [Acidianus two-tailed virus 2]